MNKFIRNSIVFIGVLLPGKGFSQAIFSTETFPILLTHQEPQERREILQVTREHGP